MIIVFGIQKWIELYRVFFLQNCLQSFVRSLVGFVLELESIMKVGSFGRSWRALKMNGWRNEWFHWPSPKRKQVDPENLFPDRCGECFREWLVELSELYTHGGFKRNTIVNFASKTDDWSWSWWRVVMATVSSPSSFGPACGACRRPLRCRCHSL